MSTSESGAALVVRESKLGLRLTSVVLLASPVVFFALLPSDRVFGDGGGRLGRLSEGVQEVLLVACGVGAALASVARDWFLVAIGQELPEGSPPW